MSVECQVSIKSQSELDIGGRETCFSLYKNVKSKLLFEEREISSVLDESAQ